MLRADACIRDDHIEFSKIINYLVDRSLYLLWDRHVHLVGAGLCFIFGGELVCGVLCAGSRAVQNCNLDKLSVTVVSFSGGGGP